MDSSSSSQILAGLATFSLIAGLIGLAIGILFIIAYWKIFSKAGFSGALALLLLVPLANIIIILYLAFAQWPIHNELNSLRAQAMQRGPQYPPQGPQY